MAALLLLGLATTLVPAWTQYQQPCRETRHGLDTGLVRMPDFGEPPHFNVSCVWSYSAPANSKVLIRVDNVHLPPDEHRESFLKLQLDDEIIDIPRNCVRCLRKNLVSAVRVKISYKSVLLEEFYVDDSPSDLATSEVGSFQIRFKAFDPKRCESPKQPLNGFATVSSREVGQEVSYGCKPPYDISGLDKAVCVVKDVLESPLPEWSSGPPKCVVGNCGSVIHRRAGFGAVTSPGYPLYVIPSALDCRWEIEADAGSQIQVSVTFLQLSNKNSSFGTLSFYEADAQLLSSFNQSRDKGVNLVTNSNKLIVTLVTTNSQTVKGGFFLEYQSFRSSCPEPIRLEFGEVVAFTWTVGSIAHYRCKPGYHLVGEAQVLCQNNGTWSHSMPKCVPHLDFQVQDFPAEGPSSYSSSTSSPPWFTTASIEENVEDDSVTIPFSAEPLSTKSTKKVKLKPTEKMLLKSTAKPKVNIFPKPTISSEGTFVLGKDELSPKEQDFEGKESLSVNAAQDKFSKPKNKENSTQAKHNHLLESEEATVPKNSVGPFPVPHLDAHDREQDAKDPETEQNYDEKSRQEEDRLGLKLYIIIGVCAALLIVAFAAIAALVAYRRRFPVRMRFGRKFSTFENPMYVSKDAKHTRELKRLTI